MNQPKIPPKKWAIEFIIILIISLTTGSAIFFLSIEDNLVVRFIVLSLSLMVALIGTYFRTYKIIFFLEAKIKEKQLDLRLLKGVGKKLASRFLIYGVIFMVFLMFEESYRQYWYIVLLVGGVLSTILNYPNYRLKYNKELLEGKLDEEEQKYVDSYSEKWYQYLFMVLPLIAIYLFF